MKIIKPGFEFITPIDGSVILKRLEECGRVCYKSEGKITDDSAPKFVAGIIKRGHEAVLEHCSFTVKFICDRGVSHEIVRHRLASYCQESTRYCNYGKDQFGSEITVIEPCYLNKDTFAYDEWKEACRRAETAYFNLLNWGLSPQEARIKTGVKGDSFVDLAGYAACAGEIATETPKVPPVNTCISCGAEIPEGRQVCPTCLKEASR